MLQVPQIGISNLGELLPVPVGCTLTPSLLLCEVSPAPTNFLPHSQNWAFILFSHWGQRHSYHVPNLYPGLKSQQSLELAPQH